MSAQGDHRPPLQLVKSAMGRSSKPTFSTHWQGSVCRRFANPRKCKHAMRGTPRAPHAGQRVYDRITRTTQAIQRTNAALHELPDRACGGPRTPVGPGWRMFRIEVVSAEGRAELVWRPPRRPFRREVSPADARRPEPDMRTRGQLEKLALEMLAKRLARIVIGIGRDPIWSGREGHTPREWHGDLRAVPRT